MTQTIRRRRRNRKIFYVLRFIMYRVKLSTPSCKRVQWIQQKLLYNWLCRVPPAEKKLWCTVATANDLHYEFERGELVVFATKYLEFFNSIIMCVRVLLHQQTLARGGNGVGRTRNAASNSFRSSSDTLKREDYSAVCVYFYNFATSSRRCVIL